MDRTSHFYIFCLTHTIFIFSNVLIIFSLGVLIYLDSNSLTQYGIFISLAYLAELLVAPIAGSIFDRYKKEKIFILCSSGIVLVHVVILYLVSSGKLALLTIYLLTVGSSLISGLHRVSYNATIPLFAIDTNKLSRYNGAVYLGIAIAHLVAPVVAGLLITEYNISRAIILAIVCGLAVLVLSCNINIPGNINQQVQNSFTSFKKILEDLLNGFYYIKHNTSLRHFLYLHCTVNFTRGIVVVLFTPMVLSFADAYTLGLLRSAAGMGMLIGGIIMSVWVGPTKLIDSILYSLFGTGIFMLLTGIKESFLIIGFSVFCFYVLTAILSTVGYTLWQKNVDSDVIGRVFAFRDMATGAALLAAYLVSPLIAENIFEPFMNSQNEIALLISSQIGHGEGRGIGLLFILMGFVTIFMAPYALTNRSIRVLKI